MVSDDSAAPKKAAGRFTEVISSDGSRNSAEAPTSNTSDPKWTPSVQRRSSKSADTQHADAQHGDAAPDSARQSKQVDAQSSGSTHHDDDGDDDDDDGEEHTWLAALYPLSHFIGFRPRSHPHTSPDRRFDRHSPNFNKWHYGTGVVLSFGLPVSGSTGEVAQYRDPTTGDVQLVTMYKDQVGAKLVNSLHSLVAAWVLIALLALLSRTPFFRAHDSPLLIGAFATEAVATFFSYRVALAQPKNILFGNTLSAVIGVALTNAFKYTNYTVTGIYGSNWAAAATTVSVAVFTMQILGCIHPPGAAIALLANINTSETRLEWNLVPITVISSLIVIAWALIINNLGGRRWPENWFYLNAFTDPPIIGPEKLPYSNAPYDWPQRRRRRRRRPRSTTGKEKETGFYRVPNSGTKTTQTLPRPSVQKPPAAVVMPESKPVSGTGGFVALKPNEEANRASTTRASETTQVGSADTEMPPTLPAVEPSHAGPETSTAPPPKSRMIESEAVSRNNSKGSKKSKRSIVVHYNENRASSSKASSDIPPVPAIQWRSSP